MNIALINPCWTFRHSIYFGCPEPHLPLEFGYAHMLLEQSGHVVLLVDAHQEQLSHATVADRLAAFDPEMLVITTAPSYLFWRCAPPELRVPMETIQTLQACKAMIVAVGPHASTTPGTTLKKLHADVAVMGEFEEVLVQLAGTPRQAWSGIPSICYRQNGEVLVQGSPHASDMDRLPALEWPPHIIRRHRHHHHRFDEEYTGLGAEIEASRGCPFHCTFCAKENFRDGYRRRPLPVVLKELDRLIGQGVEYVYFIDEIFVPHKELLEALLTRPVKFGVQLRIDQWKPDMLTLLGKAGCVSIEAGIESLSASGRDLLDKHCRLSTEELASRLVHVREVVPFVQATLLNSQADDPAMLQHWISYLRGAGVWTNEPVPLFPYPGSPEYSHRWGAPDEQAWERAHDFYLKQFNRFSDIQADHPLPLSQLETIHRSL